MKLIVQFLVWVVIAETVNAQNDSLSKLIEKNPYYLDSLNLMVKDVIITGNDITKEEIILREMSLRKGSKFNIENYEDDVRKIYNLGLFTKVDITPVPVSGKEILLNVKVQERWYIYPLPQGGIEDGEWAKKWVGLKIKWDNFRGRNETALLNFRILYNPSIHASYSVPWIGEKLHLYASLGGGYSKTRNKSLEAVGRTSGGEVITADEEDYDNTEYFAQLTVGKYITERLSVFTDLDYNHLRVSQYDTGRTVSPTGVDKYLTGGFGIKYDSRDILEFATKGYYVKTNFLVYGFLDKLINFQRFNFESQSFIPVHFTKDYYVTVASRFFTTLARGEVIPAYQHVYLGYSEDYVRGWKGPAFEGEDKIVIFNELRIPIIKPRYIGAKKIMVVRNMPFIGKLNLKYGLYLTLLYDIGTVFDRNENIFKKRFLSGTGIGLNVILPFGYVLRTEWNFRLGKPTVGQLGLSLSAKF
jgi:outer membrane protein assembly factor BamA